MLSIYTLDKDKKRCSLPAPLYLEITGDTDIPADSMRVRFSGKTDIAPAEIYVSDDDKVIFSGVVDEQILVCSENITTEIIARSMAALLLDNEACPENFVNPDRGIMVRRILNPCGIEAAEGKNKCVQGAFNITKGMSCWQVAENFGKRAYGAVPRVKGRILDFNPLENSGKICFSDNGEGIFFTQFRFNFLRCRMLSAVRAKTREQGEYSTVILNPEAVSIGVHRERYLNCSPLSGSTLSEAKEALKESLRCSQEIELICPERQTDILYAQAKVTCRGETYEGFRVKSFRYQYRNGKESTQIALCRKES